ncbi:MAG TPA: branched-chain amino acid ABC transporter permease, partial [Candidatus Binatia bacterium]|nr:branched-chain amino acid ABC transporter permease [Candidatus Binatia bacterium]
MKKYLYPLILLALLALLPLAVTSNYFLHLMILFLLWVVIGSAWNLLAGYTGQVSFGHAAFFGVGAYAAGLLFQHLQVSPWWGMAIGGIVAVLIGLPFGAICFPLRGAYFALASLALGEGIRHVATIAEKFTGGMVGIMIMPTFTSKVPYYYIALGLAILSVASIQAIINSKPGYYFVSIREDQDAAASLGINTTLYKNVSLAISAFWSGMAGALYMNYMGFIDPHVVFSLHDYSVMAILVAIVGGVGTIYGPTIGAFIMVAFQEVFRTGFFGLFEYVGKATGSPVFTSLSDAIHKAHVLGFGILVIVVILYLPNGVVGDWEKIKRN